MSSGEGSVQPDIRASVMQAASLVAFLHPEADSFCMTRAHDEGQRKPHLMICCLLLTLLAR